MAIKVSWAEKYELALSEELTVKEIMKLRTVGQPTAIEIRKQCLDYCRLNGIEVGGKRVPTEVVLLITERDMMFYYQKMLKEAELLSLKQG